MNFLFISPNFPKIYSHFIKELRYKGFTVLGIGDEPWGELCDELKENINEYCFVSDISNLDWMRNTIDYLTSKYGHIDYIESNNEYWLINDSILRGYTHSNGLLLKDMNKVKNKSDMKKYFKKANVKTARYILASNIEKSLAFVKTVGFPIFAKPNAGVGASGTFKINNYKDLAKFHDELALQNEEYIIEEYIDGYIVSFDGICDENCNVVACVQETFPIPIADVVKKDCDVYYFATTDMEKTFKTMGEKVIKAFKIKKRCFHIEFFVLNQSKKGLGDKGDILGLEVNMRCPGGNTPNLISIAWNYSYYYIYACIMKDNYTDFVNNNKKIYAISVNRKYKREYLHSEEEIFNKYSNNIKECGDYPDSFVLAMGKHFYFASFNSKKEALQFKNFVLETK